MLRMLRRLTAVRLATQCNADASQEAGFDCRLLFSAAGGNSHGQLGDGTTEDRVEPVQVATDLVFVDITAGSQHTCGLLANGSYACWGKLLRWRI